VRHAAGCRRYHRVLKLRSPDRSARTDPTSYKPTRAIILPVEQDLVLAVSSEEERGSAWSRRRALRDSDPPKPSSFERCKSAPPPVRCLSTISVVDAEPEDSERIP
jgi:hypothetical protein